LVTVALVAAKMPESLVPLVPVMLPELVTSAAAMARIRLGRPGCWRRRC
jgi:hypothetical protein